jgi:hypothetical protein
VQAEKGAYDSKQAHHHQKTEGGGGKLIGKVDCWEVDEMDQLIEMGCLMWNMMWLWMWL